ncbi:MAG: ParB N-terminal domain-containing protein, partial [Synechococcaceae cyanobacterium SM2_3_1]|nr:ParB N-terminal domain-containing protein [Synechococcaceae cyanobacterium SM2_3_1]
AGELEFDGVLKAGLNPEIEPVIWGSLLAGPILFEPYKLFTLPKIGLNIYAKAELELASTDSEAEIEITHPTAEGTYKGADPLTLNAQMVGTPEVVIYGGIDFTLRDGSVEEGCPTEDSSTSFLGTESISLEVNSDEECEPGQIVQLLPRELIPTHGQTLSNNQLDKLCKNIRSNGIQDPIKFIERDGQKFVVDGHHRLICAKKLCLRNVPAQKVCLPYGGYQSEDDLLPYEPIGF